MRQVLRSAMTAAVLLVPFATHACLNDRDSLLYEGNRGYRRDLVKTVVGWFPVHTPLFYRMRIGRCLAELRQHPEKLELYDDASVAYDRLGNDERAINVIEQKRAYMLAHGSKPQRVVTAAQHKPSEEEVFVSSLDPWYRYYANVGTFWAHRWFREGMKPEHKREWLDRAQGDIDKAIELNPYAHGLREYAQAEMIRWVRTGKPGQSFDDFLPSKFYYDDDTLLAVAGLIDLGGAWESVDVYYFLSNHAKGEDLGYFVFQRVLELQKQGKRSLTGEMFSSSRRAPGEAALDERDYHDLRQAAQEYRDSYAAYETERLQQGRHPDTDPKFWSDYKEPNFPDYSRQPGFLPFGVPIWKALFIGGVIMALVVASVKLGRTLSIAQRLVVFILIGLIVLVVLAILFPTTA